MSVNREYIHELASKPQDEVYYTTGPEDAAYTMGTIFDYSKNSICIYAGSFSGEISKDKYYQEKMDKFLLNGGRLKILLQKYDSSKEPSIFHILRKHLLLGIGSVEIKCHSNQVLQGNEESEVHFTIADDRMYRLENNILTFTSSGNFYDEAFVSHLKSIFDDIFELPSSKSIELLKPVHIGEIWPSI